MTMWRPTEAGEEDVSDLSGIDRQSKRRRSRRRAWRDGLADQTVVTTLEHARSYRAFERVLIGTVDPRSVIEPSSFIDWQACCGDFVVPVRSKPGCLSSRAKLCPRAGRTRPADPVNRERPPRGPMAVAKAPARTDETICRRATKNRCPRQCALRSDHGRSPAPSSNVSCAFPILTRPCLTAWAATKRDYGARQHKRFGPSRRCDSRSLQSGSGCATGSRPSPGIGRGRFRVTHSLGVECSDDEGCIRRGSLRKSVEASRVIRCVQEHVGLANANSPATGKFTEVNASKKRVSSSAEVAVADHRIC
jgi:hypothetical protein